MSDDRRYVRHLALFGSEGQRQIAETSVAIIGLGGLGCHVAQQLAYLGVTQFVLLDADTVSTSNLNRLLGAGPADLGDSKVEVAARVIGAIQRDADVVKIRERFSDDSPLVHLESVDVLFGCLDDDIPRFQLVRYASLHALTYIDLATDVAADGAFGGRVVFAKGGERCLSCLGELDAHALARAQMTEEQRTTDDRIYGIDRGELDHTGPSVVSVNGVVASLAVTEFMVWRTRLREPAGYLNYRGDRGTVTARADPQRGYCHYCMTMWGTERAGPKSH